MAFFKNVVEKVFLSDEMKEPHLIDLTYVWKIEDYMSIPLNESNVSKCFAVGKNSYFLELLKDENLNVKLIQVKPCDPTVKLLCAVGIVNRNGKLHHFARKEVEMGKGSETKQILKIPSGVLVGKLFDVIPNGILSVHLTINLQTNNPLLTPYYSSQSLECLSSNLRKLFEDKTNFDVVLKTGDTVYKAHRLVLSARSPTFARMFRHNSNERSKGTIDIKGVEASIFGNVLYYIYTGKVQGLSSDSAFKLAEAADKYHLHELKSISISFLAANLKVENICDAILLVEKFRDEQLEKAAFEFISKYASEIINSDQWKTFKIKHTLIANSVLCSVLLSEKTK